jgi:hypothetical protein
MVGNSVSSGPNILLKRADLAAEIGNICVNWNLVEDALMNLYALIMGDYLPRLTAELIAKLEHEAGTKLHFGASTHPVARQIFDALNAFNPRLQLVEKLLVWRVSPANVSYFRKTIMPSLRKRFAERSLIAHGKWGVCDKYPDELILMPTFGPNMRYKKRDFQDVSKRIVADHSILGKYSHELYQSRVPIRATTSESA